MANRTPSSNEDPVKKLFELLKIKEFTKVDGKALEDAIEKYNDVLYELEKLKTNAHDKRQVDQEAHPQKGAMPTNRSKNNDLQEPQQRTKQQKGEPTRQREVDRNNDKGDKGQRKPSPGEPHSSLKSSEKLFEERRTTDRLRQQVDELQYRLSELTGELVTEGNTEITDLSDPYRPQKLGELFRELYDNEWTNAYEEIGKIVGEQNERKIVKILASTVEAIDEFCDEKAAAQIKSMERASTSLVEIGIAVEENPKPDAISNLSEQLVKTVKRHVFEIRRDLANISQESVAKLFFKEKMGVMQKLLTTNEIPEQFRVFVSKAVEYVWMMKLQQKPMVMVWAKEKDNVNTKLFKFYTQKGTKVDMSVWPAVLLYDDGPTVSKGIVQGQDERSQTTTV